MHPKRVPISKEEHARAAEKISNPSPGRKVLTHSPIVDVQRAELLLGIDNPQHHVHFVLNFEEGHERCSHCYRHFSVLDLISTALRSHSAEFLKGILFSNETFMGGDPHTLICFDCGHEGPAPLYQGPTYACCVGGDEPL